MYRKSRIRNNRKYLFVYWGHTAMEVEMNCIRKRGKLRYLENEQYTVKNLWVKGKKDNTGVNVALHAANCGSIHIFNIQVLWTMMSLGLSHYWDGPHNP